jgi:16S rRNA pseudouridine516 synthase
MSQHPNPEDSRRVDFWLSHFGYCQRSQVKSFIEQHTIQGCGREKLHADTRLPATALLIDGQPIPHPHGLLVMLHKPCGLVCSHDSRDGVPVYRLLPDWLQRRHLQSIGRLDKNTSGLLLLTDRGDWLHRLTSPKYAHARKYQVTVNKSFSETESLIEIFASGQLQLHQEKTPCQPAQLTITGDKSAEITLYEGRYHQVRRMFAACGYHVETLHRDAFGSWALGDLAEGSFLILESFEEVL